MKWHWPERRPSLSLGLVKSFLRPFVYWLPTTAVDVADDLWWLRPWCDRQLTTPFGLLAPWRGGRAVPFALRSDHVWRCSWLYNQKSSSEIRSDLLHCLPSQLLLHQYVGVSGSASSFWHVPDRRTPTVATLQVLSHLQLICKVSVVLELLKKKGVVLENSERLCGWTIATHKGKLLASFVMICFINKSSSKIT